MEKKDKKRKRATWSVLEHVAFSSLLPWRIFPWAPLLKNFTVCFSVNHVRKGETKQAQQGDDRKNATMSEDGKKRTEQNKFTGLSPFLLSLTHSHAISLLRNLHSDALDLQAGIRTIMEICVVQASAKRESVLVAQREDNCCSACPKYSKHPNCTR